MDKSNNKEVTIENNKNQKKEILEKLKNNEFIKFGSMSSFVFDKLSSSEKYCFCNSDYWCNKCYGEL
tara:strand:+ start:104 stop:304 length:201 start_codon:yes stop_codon:yes gene_type:complete